MLGRAHECPTSRSGAACLDLGHVVTGTLRREVAGEQAVAGGAVIVSAIVVHRIGGGDVIRVRDPDRGLGDPTGRVADADALVVRGRQQRGQAEALAGQLPGMGLVRGQFGGLVALDEDEAIAGSGRAIQPERPAVAVHPVEVVAHGRHARLLDAEVGVDHA